MNYLCILSWFLCGILSLLILKLYKELSGLVLEDISEELVWGMFFLDLLRDNDFEQTCKRCRTKACPDCFGSGFMGGGAYGIYCSCKYSYYAAIRNGELDEEFGAFV